MPKFLVHFLISFLLLGSFVLGFPALVSAVSTPVIEYSPSVIEKGKTTEINVSINLGSDLATFYHIFTTRNSGKLELSFPGLTILCGGPYKDPDSGKECMENPRNDLFIKNPTVDENNVVHFKLDPSIVSISNFQIQVGAYQTQGTDTLIEGTQVTRALTVRDATIDGDIDAVFEPASIDTSKTAIKVGSIWKGAPLRIVIRKPRVENYTVILDLGNIRATTDTPQNTANMPDNPSFNPVVRCFDPSVPCTTTFYLPKCGLPPGAFTAEIYDSEKVKRGQATLTINDDSVGRPPENCDYVLNTTPPPVYGSGINCDPVGGTQNGPTTAGGTNQSKEAIRKQVEASIDRNALTSEARSYSNITPGDINNFIQQRITEETERRFREQQAVNKPGGIMTAIGCVPREPKALVEGLLKVTAMGGGGVAFLLMIFGALQMVTSAGNPDTLKKGQDQFKAAIIGLLFVLFSVVLLQIIGVDILDLPGFGR